MEIANRYKSMSKLNDEWRMSAVDGSIATEVQKGLAIRADLIGLRKKIMEEWIAVKDAPKQYE